MRELRIAAVGGGMFFEEVIGQTLKDFEDGGFAGALTSIGMSHFAPAAADIRCVFTAIGTHSAKRGSADRIKEWFKADCPQSKLHAYYGDSVWETILAEQNPDILFVATPDHLHAEPILSALEH
ncbi:MAG: hypothetical protein ACP5I1_08590, partial [Candidatus Hinthialibacter sp.]